MSDRLECLVHKGGREAEKVLMRMASVGAVALQRDAQSWASAACRNAVSSASSGSEARAHGSNAACEAATCAVQRTMHAQPGA